MRQYLKQLRSSAHAFNFALIQLLGGLRLAWKEHAMLLFTFISFMSFARIVGHAETIFEITSALFLGGCAIYFIMKDLLIPVSLELRKSLTEQEKQLLPQKRHRIFLLSCINQFLRLMRVPDSCTHRQEGLPMQRATKTKQDP